MEDQPSRRPFQLGSRGTDKLLVAQSSPGRKEGGSEGQEKEKESAQRRKKASFRVGGEKKKGQSSRFARIARNKELDAVTLTYESEADSGSGVP